MSSLRIPDLTPKVPLYVFLIIICRPDPEIGLVGLSPVLHVHQQIVENRLPTDFTYRYIYNSLFYVQIYLQFIILCTEVREVGNANFDKKFLD